MQNMFGSYYTIKIIEAALLSILVAFVTTPLSIQLAHKIGVIDKPSDSRRVHKKPIPRFGGMAIFLGSMAGLLIPAGMNTKIKIAILGGIMMYLLGVVDDILDIKPIQKFFEYYIDEFCGVNLRSRKFVKSIL